MEIAAQGFPESLLHGRAVAPSPDTLVRLTAYVEQVNRLRFTAEQSADRLTRLAAPGLEILVLSIQAVTQARQLLAEGQGLWRELVRGVADYPAVYRQLLDRPSRRIGADRREGLMIGAFTVAGVRRGLPAAAARPSHRRRSA